MNHLEKLAEIVGPENVSAEPEDIVSYETDASQMEGTAQAVVWPTTPSEVQQIIRMANLRDFHLVPRGAGTSLDGSTIPKDSIILDMNKMNRILALHREERFVILEPGVTLKRLNAVLARYNLFFPIIPGSSKVCTIGGMIANNSFGAYSYKLGRAGDWVMELEVVDGSGKIFEVKDPTRIIGSEGNFAVIVNIKLKLLPPLKILSSAVYEYDNADEVFAKMQELEQDQTMVSLYYMDKMCSQALDNQNEKHKLIAEFLPEGKGDYGDKQELRDSLNKVLHNSRYHYIKQIVVPKTALDAFLKYTRRNKIPTSGSICNGFFTLYYNITQKKLMTETMEYVKSIAGEPMNYGLANYEYLTDAKKAQLAQFKKVYDPVHTLNRGKIK